MLSREGLIARIDTAGSQRRFDAETGDHQHIRCVRCGRVDDVPSGARRTKCDERVGKETGYRVLGRRVEYLGVCRACRKQTGRQ